MDAQVMPMRLYFAHPLSAPSRVGIQANLARAHRWLAFLIVALPGVAFEVSWLSYATILDDRDPLARARAIRDNRSAILGCAAGIFCGGAQVGRLGQFTPGMLEERTLLRDQDSGIVDITDLGPEPPPLGDITGLPAYDCRDMLAAIYNRVSEACR